METKDLEASNTLIAFVSCLSAATARVVNSMSIPRLREGRGSRGRSWIFIINIRLV